MDTKGERTRERILETAEKIILGKGFSGTSLDEILDSSGVTKGGFFYHFRGKNDLAVHLIHRYRKQDAELFEKLWSRAGELAPDPLEKFLTGLELLANTFADLPGGHPGCLVASFTYESQIFDPEVRGLVAEGLLVWRAYFKSLLQDAAAAHPPKAGVNLDELADMLTVVVEGGIILSRSLNDSTVLPKQVLHFRDYVRSLFTP